MQFAVPASGCVRDEVRGRRCCAGHRLQIESEVGRLVDSDVGHPVAMQGWRARRKLFNIDHASPGDIRLRFAYSTMEGRCFRLKLDAVALDASLVLERKPEQNANRPSIAIVITATRDEPRSLLYSFFCPSPRPLPSLPIWAPVPCILATHEEWCRNLYSMSFRRLVSDCVVDDIVRNLVVTFFVGEKLHCFVATEGNIEPGEPMVKQRKVRIIESDEERVLRAIHRAHVRTSFSSSPAVADGGCPPVRQNKFQQPQSGR